MKMDIMNDLNNLKTDIPLEKDEYNKWLEDEDIISNTSNIKQEEYRKWLETDTIKCLILKKHL